MDEGNAVERSITGRASKTSTKSKRGKKSKAKDNSLGGMFEGLTLEEPSLNPLGDAPPTVKISTTPGSPEVQLELENEDEDSAFETWCFLQDLADVRKFVKKAWIEYSHGHLSFLAVTMITETAFGLRRRADEEFARSGPLESSAYDKILDFLGVSFFTRNNAIWMCPDPDRSSTNPRVPNSSINIVDLLSPVAYMVLCSCKDKLHHLCKIDNSPEAERPELVAKVVNSHSGLDELARVLSDLMPELNRIGHASSCQCVVVDEFLQGLIDLHRHTRMEMWLVVATDIYLDVQGQVGNNLERGARVLQRTFDYNTQLADDVHAYMSNSHDHMQGAANAMHKIEWLARAAANRSKAPIEKPTFRHEHTSKPGEPTTACHKPDCVANPMERSLPTYSGAILADLKLGLYGVGCEIANHGALVLTAAHLYKGLRAMGALKKDWHDMEFVIASFGTAKKPMVSKTGHVYNGEAAVRHYHMSLGLSAQNFAPDARSRKLTIHKARELSITSPLLRTLHDRSADWSTRGLGNTKIQAVEAVLQALASQTLATFKKKLVHDEPLLNFDFVEFTMRIGVLVEEVRSRVGLLLNGEDATDDHYHMSLVTCLLRAPPSSKAIWQAADILQTHMETDGKAFVQRAYNDFSGRIPKHLRPNIEHGAEDTVTQRTRLLASVLLDYANVKYTYAGPTLAAYHPGIKPELCEHGSDPNCCKPPPDSETDLANCDHNEPNFMSLLFGSGIPKAIQKAAETEIARDPTRFRECQRKLVHDALGTHGRGKSTAVEVQRFLGILLGMTVFSALSEGGKHAWFVCVPAKHYSFATWYKIVTEWMVEQTQEGSSNTQIPVPPGEEYVVVPMSWYFEDETLDDYWALAEKAAGLLKIEHGDQEGCVRDTAAAE